MWRVLVLGILQEGLTYDFYRLQDLVNHHDTVQEMLVHRMFNKNRNAVEHHQVSAVEMSSSTVLIRARYVAFVRARTDSLGSD